MSIEITIQTLEEWALVAAAAVIVVSLFYLLMALGWRRGEFVMGGRHPRRLPPQLRRLSFLFGILLVLGAGVVALLSGELSSLGAPGEWAGLIPMDWERSASFVVTVFFAVAGLVSIGRGARLERFLFGPVMLINAVVAALLGFG